MRPDIASGPLHFASISSADEMSSGSMLKAVIRTSRQSHIGSLQISTREMRRREGPRPSKTINPFSKSLQPERIGAPADFQFPLFPFPLHSHDLNPSPSLPTQHPPTLLRLTTISSLCPHSLPFLHPKVPSQTLQFLLKFVSRPHPQFFSRFGGGVGKQTMYFSTLSSAH